MDISNIRKDYSSGTLDDDNSSKKPYSLFEKWFNIAVSKVIVEPTAMILSTVNPDGMPRSRVVLLKYHLENEFFFFSNYNSSKAKELLFSNKASVLFFWPQLEQQIRIEGVVEKCSDECSDNYFNERPILSRISACISPQSSVIPSRKWLDDEHSKFCKSNQNPQRPNFWGGYKLVADFYEFWQGRENRLHDRLQYKLISNTWSCERLAP